MVRAIMCDDEEDSIVLIQHYLKEHQSVIEVAGTASDGREALRLIQTEKPDLVFMDIQMPYMNGLEVIAEIAKEQENIKFIIITAFDSFTYAQQALRLGASDILTKPIDFQQLGVAISKAIGFNITESKMINRVLEHIHEHYTEEIRLDELSDIFYCSKNHIAREFKKNTGMTILNYVHKKRVEEAVNLMKDSNYSIAEISERVGYQNINNFYKYFKLYQNMTPAAYANSHKG